MIISSSSILANRIPRLRLIGFASAAALATCGYISFSDQAMAAKTRKKTPVTPERLMQFGFAYAPPLIIGAAVNSKVFDTLESGPKTIEQVSRITGASQRGLRAIMNALVGPDLLKKDRQGKYSLTAESEAFLVSNKPGTLAGFFAMVSSTSKATFLKPILETITTLLRWAIFFTPKARIGAENCSRRPSPLLSLAAQSRSPNGW
jgi:hypothetical protein